MTVPGAVAGIATAVLAALACAGLIVLLRPVLAQYALAKPNARSSHVRPTPQGGGIAVVAATIVAALFGLATSGNAAVAPLAPVLAATLLMTIVGAVDDVRTLGVMPRLVLQTLAVATVIYVLPDDQRAVPAMPWWIERLLIFAAGLWFVNLVNFMDGIDWMTAAEVVPLAAALAVLGWLGALPPYGLVVALALGGAMTGFAWFNRPVAMLFLGDVGSLPIGLLLGWLLLLLASGGHLVAALILPLYYLADATITLLLRLARGEAIAQAHRSHFYQLATVRGLSVTAVVTRVFAVNCCLGVLAAITVIAPGLRSDIAALVVAAILVAWLLARLAGGRNPPGARPQFRRGGLR